MRIASAASAVVIGCLFMTGCGMTGKKVRLPYTATGNLTGGSGDLYLAVPEEKGTAEKQPVVGTMRNRYGEAIGDVVTDVSPAKLLANAFAEEFTSAGYTVKQVEALPPGVPKGIRFVDLRMKLEQTTSLLKLDASSTVNASAELWKNGAKVTRVDYEANYADSSAMNRDPLLQDTLEKAVHSLMKQAVPEMIRGLGDQPTAKTAAVTPTAPPVVTTKPVTPTEEPTATIAAPKGLTVLRAPDGLYLVWQGSPQDPGAVTGYEIARAEVASGPYVRIAEVPKGTYFYLDKSAKPETTYFYKVRAIAGNRTSAYSNEAAAERVGRP